MYIPAPSLSAAQNFNQALWLLFKPPGYVGVTTAYCRVLTHPTLPQWTLEIPDKVTVPLMNPDFTPLAPLLLAGGKVTQAEITALQAKAINHQGQQVLVSDYLPLEILATSQTHDQLLALGWFPSSQGL